MATAITDADFEEEVLNVSTPVLVDFWAPWCGPCIAMTPVMEELTSEYAGKVKVVKVNVDDNIETAGRYNVMSIPTFIIFQGGTPAATFVGAKSKEDIKKELNKLVS